MAWRTRIKHLVTRQPQTMSSSLPSDSQANGIQTHASSQQPTSANTTTSLHDLALSTFDSLQQQSQLLHAPHITTNYPSSTFPATFQLAPHLGHKPVLSADAPERRSNNAKANPFANPDPAFVLPFHSATHTLMLNKYCVYRPQLLLVTKSYRPQYEALDAGDVTAAWMLMSQLEDATAAPHQSEGRRWLAFYNCGAESGSSQGHKHVQVVPRPEQKDMGFDLFPDRASLTDNVEEAVKAVPHKHFVLRLPSEAGVEEAVRAYQTLLARMMAFFQEQGWKTRDGGSNPPHNVLMTKDWVCLIPRRRSGIERYAMANALGMTGVLWITHPSQIECYTTVWGSLDKHMAHLGFPAS